MWYVYIIRSIEFPDQEYIGATEDLKRRLPEHNAGRSAHTAKFKPWQLVWYCAFPDKYKALAFEKYLKSHQAAPSPRSASSPSRLHLLPQRRIQLVAQPFHFLLQRGQLRHRTFRRCENRQRQAARFFLQRLALRGQRDDHLPLVFPRARAL